MQTISFIREQRDSNSCPVLMVRDNKRMFVINHALNPNALLPAYRDNIGEVQKATKQLASNDGKYFCVSSFIACPFKLLDYMQANLIHFVKNYQRLTITETPEGYIDVKGHLNAYNALVFYRFYDKAALTDWINKAIAYQSRCLDQTTVDKFTSAEALAA